MSVNTVVHLNFRGDARHALEFYQSVFGGEVSAFTYKEFGIVKGTAEDDQLIWGQTTADNGFRVMAYDVPANLPWNQGENAFFVSLRGEAPEEVTGFWKKLSAGATVVQELAPSQWAPLYGMLKDRFGITWVVDVANQYAAA